MGEIDKCINFILITEVFGELLTSKNPANTYNQVGHKSILYEHPEYPFNGIENVSIIVTNDENTAQYCYCQAYQDIEQSFRRF